MIEVLAMLHTATLVLALATLAATDEVPYGHPDFYPSPERPIGHRGDGNGWFPGATPVTEWWDGTVSQVEMPIADRGNVKPKKVWDLAATGAKNIVWRVEEPSWANTQPLAVGDLIFSYGEPDLLFCHDAHTGRLLWQVRLSPWRAAGLSEAEVRANELMHDVYGALEVYRFYAVTGTSTRGGPPSQTTFSAIHRTFVDTCLPRLVADLKQADPQTDWDAPAQGEAKRSECVLAASQAGEKDAKLPHRLVDLARAITDRISTVGEIKVRLDTPWGHMVGHQMSCPVADGRFIYVQMGQGQVAALDLTGKIIWARLTSIGNGKDNEHHIRSPLLAGGVLITTIGGDTLRAYDAATGAPRWEAPFPAAGCRSVGTDKIVRLGTGAAAVEVLVTTHGNVIRVRDGKVLGTLPFTDAEGKPITRIDGGPSMVSVPQADGSALVFKGASGDNFSTAYTAFRLVPTADGVTITKAFDLGDRSVPGLHGIVATDRWLLMPSRGRNLVEAATGKVLNAKALDRMGDMSLIVAGSYAIGHDQKTESNDWGHRRPDGKMLCRFTVLEVGDPTAPQRVAEANVLGGSFLPRFPPADKYLPELWSNPAFVNGCGGRVSHFIHLDTGLTALANRFFVRSTGHLYCLGDPAVAYAWRPASRPAGIALPAR
jgi:outer membrane protein assembly factor BamB